MYKDNKKTNRNRKSDMGVQRHALMKIQRQIGNTKTIYRYTHTKCRLAALSSAPFSSSIFEPYFKDYQCSSLSLFQSGRDDNGYDHFIEGEGLDLKLPLSMTIYGKSSGLNTSQFVHGRIT